jgi:hypothetical protein
VLDVIDDDLSRPLAPCGAEERMVGAGEQCKVEATGRSHRAHLPWTALGERWGLNVAADEQDVASTVDERGDTTRGRGLDANAVERPPERSREVPLTELADPGIPTEPSDEGMVRLHCRAAEPRIAIGTDRARIEGEDRVDRARPEGAECQPSFD